MEEWRPQVVIVAVLRKLQAAVASAVASASPRISHRDGRTGRAGSPLGGSLAAAIRSPGLVDTKPWGGVLRFYDLGQKFWWFIHGTRTGGRLVKSRGKAGAKTKRVGGSYRQQPRPVELVPDVEGLTNLLREDAVRHYDRLDAAAERAAA